MPRWALESAVEIRRDGDAQYRPVQVAAVHLSSTWTARVAAGAGRAASVCGPARHEQEVKPDQNAAWQHAKTVRKQHEGGSGHRARRTPGDSGGDTQQISCLTHDRCFIACEHYCRAEAVPGRVV